MFSKAIIWAFTAFFIANASSATAQSFTGSKLLEFIDGEDLALNKRARSYVAGLAMGYSWTAAYSKSEGVGVFCAPLDQKIDVDDHIQMLRIAIKKRPSDGNDPAGLTLLFALIDTYPCE